MTATVPFDDILSAMPDDERAEVEARAAGMLVEGLNVKPSATHQIEKPQASSLRRWTIAPFRRRETIACTPGRRAACRLVPIGLPNPC